VYPNAEPSEDSFDWEYWASLEDPPPSPRPTSPKEFGQADENQAEHAQQPNSGSSTDSEFDWHYWTNLEDPPLTRPAPPKEFGQAHENQAEHAQRPNLNPGPPKSTDSDFDWEYWMNLEDPPPSNPRLPAKLDSDRNSMAAYQSPPYPLPPTEFDRDHDVNPSSPSSYPSAASSPTRTEFYSADTSLTDPEPEGEMVPGPPPTPESADPSDHQSLSAQSQPVDLQAAIYAAKGKAMQSRRISGTSRDVWNVAL
jgi:hypothetical protein